MTTPRPVAAALEEAATWLDDQLAGGVAPKPLVIQAIASLRWIAGQERAGWPETTDGQPVVLGLAAYREAQTQTHEGAA